MLFKLIETKKTYLHSKEEQFMINELETICHIHYHWDNLTSEAVRQIYKRNLPIISKYYINKEQAEWEATHKKPLKQKSVEQQLSLFDNN